jgi:hypothetical protein
MPENPTHPSRQGIEQGEEGRRRFEADIITRQNNVLPLDAARNEGRFYGKIIRSGRPLNGIQRVGFFLVGSLFCGSAFFMVVDAFPGLLRLMGLRGLAMGDKSISMVSLPFAALAVFLGLRLIHAAIVPRKRKP